MQDIELTPEQKLFHAILSAYLSARIYNDTCAVLLTEVPINNTKGEIIKGNKSFRALASENEARSKKHIVAIQEHFKKTPGFIELVEPYVAQLQVNMQSLIELSPQGQKRIAGLVERIRNDKSEIEFWNDLTNQS